MKIFYIFLVLSLFTCFSSAQDLIYTISGELDEEKTAIDSILVENVSNNSRILFDNLSPRDYYEVNLTKLTTNINVFNNSPDFVVTRNMPGMLTLNYNKNVSTDVKISIYNIRGQKVYISENKKLTKHNSVTILLAQEGIFFVKVETPFATNTFKAIGSSQSNNFNIEVSNKSALKKTIKSAVVPVESDFSYVIGDSIIISVFKEGYYASPIPLRITVSEELEFIFNYTSFFDSRNGKLYKTIKIGEQTWMAENLTYLPFVTSPTYESLYDSMYYVYGYDGTDTDEAIKTENYKIYGVLYNWPAAINACPIGWHLPTDDDWNALVDYLTNNGYGFGDDKNAIGKSLAAKSYWDFSSIAGTPGNDSESNDKSLFSGLPSGFFNRGYTNHFAEIGQNGYWWSATENSSADANVGGLRFDSGYFGKGSSVKRIGFCVRCIKDSE